MIWLIFVVLAGGLLLLGVMTNERKRPVHNYRRSHSSLDLDMVRHRWGEIERGGASGGLGLKGAVSEADKLLDYVLKGQGFAGETMAIRLKHAQGRLSNREAVWQAHKLRNHLSHEVGFETVSSHAREAIAAYGQALRDLGALQ